MKKQRNILLALFISLTLALSACTPSTPLAQKSTVKVLGNIANSEPSTITHAQIILTKGKTKVEELVPVNNNEFSASIQVPIGEWELLVLLINSEGKVEFQSKGEKIEVSLGKQSKIDLSLRPADSEVLVRINLENYIFSDLAMRARIHFDDAVHEVTRDNLKDPLEKVISLSPGSYEFKIELYTESFRAGDRLGLGMWDVVHIEKNEAVTIDWSPESEKLHVSGQVETILPAPRNLQIKKTDQQVTISWDPVPHEECNGYFLLSQTNLLERYELLNSKPLSKAEYQYELAVDEKIEKIRFVVAAVSQRGLVGYYSTVESYQP